MKVIAINDAPIPFKFAGINFANGYSHNGHHYERAYYKGEVFEVYESSHLQTRTFVDDFLIICHHRLQTTMNVNPENFITLDEWRERKLIELGV